MMIDFNTYRAKRSEKPTCNFYSQINNKNLVTFPHLVQFLKLREIYHSIKLNPCNRLSELISSQIKKCFN